HHRVFCARLHALRRRSDRHGQQVDRLGSAAVCCLFRLLLADIRTRRRARAFLTEKTPQTFRGKRRVMIHVIFRVLDEIGSSIIAVVTLGAFILPIIFCMTAMFSLLKQWKNSLEISPRTVGEELSPSSDDLVEEF